MVSAVILRILSDLGVYLTFAGTVAAALGADIGPLYFGWLALTAAFTLSWLLRRRGWPRYLPLLLPAAVFGLSLRTLPGWIVFAPITVYTVFLIKTERYDPEHSFEGTLFSVYWKALPLPIILCLLDRRGAILSGFTLPTAFVTLLSLILLVRSLRHGPEMRSSAKYQLGELAAVLAAGAAAILLGSNTALRLFAAGAKAVYRVIIFPVLYLAAQLIVLAVRGIAKLVYLLRVNFSGASGEGVSIKMPSLEEIKIDGVDDAGTSPIAEKVITVLGILILLTALFLFFRWLAGNIRSRRGYGGSGVTCTTIPEAEDELPGFFARGSAGKVRAAYRKFLKLSASRGIARKRSDSSLEVLNSCSGVFSADTAGRLRDIYIRARYDDSAAPEDAAAARKLVSELKKQ